MPYSSNDELPSSIKDAIPSSEGQSLFREVVNERLDAGKSKEVSFAAAWSALKNAGYEKQDGEWIKKAFDINIGDKVEFDSDLADDAGPFTAKVTEVTEEGIKTSNNSGRTIPFDKIKNLYKETKNGTHFFKRFVDDDVFTTEIEAESRSQALGFGGRIHSHDTAEGQKVYMPGESHSEYMQGPGEDEPEPVGEKEINVTINGSGSEDGKVVSAIRAIMDSVMGKSNKGEETDFTVASNITKVDEDKRLVTGWASVIEEDGEAVVDKQGDMITEDELVKAAHKFISEHRAAKSMHKGEQIGQVVESMVFTEELQKQLGVNLGKVGWLITMKIDDDETWKRVKSGEFKGFSIGGKAKRVQA